MIAYVLLIMIAWFVEMPLAISIITTILSVVGLGIRVLLHIVGDDYE